MEDMLKTLRFRGHDRDYGLLMSKKSIVNDIVQQSKYCGLDTCNQLYLSFKVFNTTSDYEPIRIEAVGDNIDGNPVWYYHSEYSDGLFFGDPVNAQTTEGKVIDMARLFPDKMPDHIITESYIIHNYPIPLQDNLENPFYREGVYERLHFNAKELRKHQIMHNDIFEKYDIFITEANRNRNRNPNRMPLKNKLQRYTVFL